MSLGNYDGWKLRTPEDEMPPDPRDDTTCPHGEDCDCGWCIAEAIEADMGLDEPIPGPNGCTCGHNGDCNCRFVP